MKDRIVFGCTVIVLSIGMTMLMLVVNQPQQAAVYSACTIICSLLTALASGIYDKLEQIKNKLEELSNDH